MDSHIGEGLLIFQEFLKSIDRFNWDNNGEIAYEHLVANANTIKKEYHFHEI